MITALDKKQWPKQIRNRFPFAFFVISVVFMNNNKVKKAKQDWRKSIWFIKQNVLRIDFYYKKDAHQNENPSGGLIPPTLVI